MSKYTASVSINAKSNLQKVTGGIDKSLKGVNKTLKRNKINWDKVGRASKAAMKGAAVGVAAVAGAALASSAAIYKLTKSTADYGDTLAKTSQKTGVLVGDLQTLEYSTKLGGGTQQDLYTGLRVFSRAIDEGSQGIATYSDEFDRMGINLRNSDGKLKSTKDLLYEVSDAFADMEDGAVKTSIAQQLLGRGGSSMIPMLNAGSKALKEQGEWLRENGTVMTEDQAKASEKFNDDLLRLNTAIKGIGYTIGNEFMPEVNKFILSLTSQVKPLKEAIESNQDLKNIIGEVSDALSEIDLKAAFEWSMDYIDDFLEGTRVILDRLREIKDFWTRVIPQEELAKSRFDVVNKVSDSSGIIQATKSITDGDGKTQVFDINMKIDKDGNPVSVETKSNASRLNVILPTMIPEGL